MEGGNVFMVLVLNYLLAFLDFAHHIVITGTVRGLSVVKCTKLDFL